MVKMCKNEGKKLLFYVEKKHKHLESNKYSLKEPFHMQTGSV